MRYVIATDDSPRRYTVTDLDDETRYFSKEKVAEIRGLDVAPTYGETALVGVKANELFHGKADEVMLFLLGLDGGFHSYGFSYRFVTEGQYDKAVLEKHAKIQSDAVEHEDLLAVPAED